MVGQCMLCLKEPVEVTHINLYIVGSEGTYACHSCEMRLVEFARALRNESAYHKLQEMKGERMATYVFAVASSDGHLEEPITANNQTDILLRVKEWFIEAYATDAPDYYVSTEITECQDLKTLAKIIKREGYKCWLVRIPDIHTNPPQLERVL